MGRVARVGLMSGAVVTAVVVSGVLPAAAAVSTTSVVSAAPDGANADNDSDTPSVSSDGRYVAFASSATNLVAGDTNGSYDVFVRDMSTGTVVRVSVSSDEVEGDSSSGDPWISSDGRYVAFESSATSLVAGDTNSTTDIFVRDLTAGTTVRVSLDSDEVEGDSGSYDASISADGRYVAFESSASSLVAGDTNAIYDIFVRDLTAGTTVRVSVDSDEVEANADSYDASISSDGRFVAFESDATNLVAGDTNGFWDVFVRDLTGTTTVRVSVDSDEVEGDSGSYDPSISADGRFVAFESFASSLVAGDTNGQRDIFVRDLTSTTTVRVSVDSDEVVEGNNSSFDPSISADGRFVAFESYATNLVAGDTNGTYDVFTRDLTATTTVRVSVNSLGVQGNFGSFDPSISADGRYVGFESAATNLTTVTDPPADDCEADDGPTYADDTNCDFDVFIAGSPAELPPTGANPAGVVLVAVVLLGAGTCVLGLRRARTA